MRGDEGIAPYEWVCNQNAKLQFALPKQKRNQAVPGSFHSIFDQRTYSMTTRRLGSVPVEWVVMLSISCRAAWITWRS